jgi:hypothetical protein
LSNCSRQRSSLAVRHDCARKAPGNPLLRLKVKESARRAAAGREIGGRIPLFCEDQIEVKVPSSFSIPEPKARTAARLARSTLPFFRTSKTGHSAFCSKKSSSSFSRVPAILHRLHFEELHQSQLCLAARRALQPEVRHRSRLEAQFEQGGGFRCSSASRPDKVVVSSGAQIAARAEPAAAALAPKSRAAA